MAHTPHTYSTGDTITAALLNQAEQDLAAAQTAADVAAAVTAASTNDRARANHTGTQAASTITGLSTVATSGAYTDLSAKPTIPTVGAAGAGAAVALSSTDASVTNSRTPTAHTHPASDLTATGTRDATTFLRGDNTWATPAGGGGGAGLPATVVNKTTAYTAAAGDFVQADATSAGFTVTLPAAPAVGALVAVKKVDASANTLTIAPSGGGTIDGDPTATTTTKMAGAIFEHVGTNVWRIVASMTTTGPAGPAGPQGAAGTAGAAATVTVGTTTTLAAGASATVTNSGTSSAAVFNFGIPQGAAGTGGSGGGLALPAFRAGIHLPTPQGTLDSGNLTDGRLAAVPFLVEVAQSFDRIGIEVTGVVAGASLRLGVYASRTDAYPGAKLAEAGPSDAGNNGYRELPITLTLQPGLYWLTAVGQGGAVGVRMTGNYPAHRFLASDAPTNYAFSVVSSYFQDGVTGTLPATFTSTVSTGGNSTGPYVVLRTA